jgi:alpha-glucoside transport system substrate-binding protein
VSRSPNGRLSRVAALGVITTLLLSACASSSPSASQGPLASGQIGGALTIWTAWGGGELAAFQKVLEPFTANTGIDVSLTTVRDIAQLAINVEAGTKLPDIASPPTPDKREDWAKDGVMKPLEDFIDIDAYTSATYPALTTCDEGTCVDIGVVDGKHYQLYVKTQVKGLQWYNAKVFTDEPPATYDDMLAITPPSGASLFCMGLESGADSGWPASDMVGNIIMRQSGAQVFTDWYQGKHKWNSPEIRAAYELFGKMADKAYGGPNTVLSTAFQRGHKPLFTDPPGCLFYEQATFVTAFFLEDYPDLKAVDDYNFFVDPVIDPANEGNVMGFADSFVMYNDTPQARAFMNFMTTKEAQEIFVAAGGTLAARADVTNFPDPVFATAADVAANATNLLPTPGDLMPSDMKKAYWKSLLDFVNDQSKLDSLLTHLDEVQAASYPQ